MYLTMVMICFIEHLNVYDLKTTDKGNKTRLLRESDKMVANIQSIPQV